MSAQSQNTSARCRSLSTLPHYEIVIDACCFLFMFVNMGITSTTFNMFQPYINALPTMNDTLGSLVVSTRMLFAFLATFVTAAYYRKLDCRVGVTFACLLTALGSVVFAFSTSFPLFVLGAACTGTAYGIGGTVAMTLVIGRWFTRNKATALGIASMGTGLAAIALPPIVTHLVETMSLQTAFLFEAVLAACIAALLFALLRNRPPAPVTENTTATDIEKYAEPAKTSNAASAPPAAEPTDAMGSTDATIDAEGTTTGKEATGTATIPNTAEVGSTATAMPESLIANIETGAADATGATASSLDTSTTIGAADETGAANGTLGARFATAATDATDTTADTLIAGATVDADAADATDSRTSTLDTSAPNAGTHGTGTHGTSTHGTSTPTFSTSTKTNAPASNGNPSPTPRNPVLSRGDLRLMQIAVFLLGGTSVGSNAYLSVLLKTGGFDAYFIAAVLSLSGICLMTFKLVAGIVLDKAGVRRGTAMFYLLFFVGQVLLCFTPLGIAVFAFLGVFFSYAGQPISSIGVSSWALDFSDEASRARTIKRFQLFFTAGTFLCCLFPGALYDALGSYEVTYVLFAVAIAVSGTIVVRTYKKHRM